MKKDAEIRGRISKRLKERFVAALEQDGLTESDWIIANVVRYVEGKEGKKLWKIKRKF